MALKGGYPNCNASLHNVSAKQMKDRDAQVDGPASKRAWVAYALSPPPSPWENTYLPGLSRRPPAGHWQHIRMYSCSACWWNIQWLMLRAGSPGEHRVRGRADISAY